MIIFFANGIKITHTVPGARNAEANEATWRENTINNNASDLPYIRNQFTIGFHFQSEMQCIHAFITYSCNSRCCRRCCLLHARDAGCLS